MKTSGGPPSQLHRIKVGRLNVGMSKHLSCMLGDSELGGNEIFTKPRRILVVALYGQRTSPLAWETERVKARRVFGVLSQTGHQLTGSKGRYPNGSS